MSEEFETQNDNEFDFLLQLTEFMDQEEMVNLKIATPEEREKFQIQSKEQANYFIKKLKEIQEKKEEITSFAQKEIDKYTEKIKTWQEKEIAKTQNEEEYYLKLLQNFATINLEGSKKKSISLPFGSVGFRKMPDKYEFDDEKVLKELKKDDKLEKEYVSYTPKFNKSELKKAGDIIDNKLYIDGKEIEGITVTAQPDKFEVK